MGGRLMRRAVWSGALAAALVAAVAASAQPLPEEDCGGLYWDLTAAFDAGDRLYARVLVTNEGPGEHSAVALGHWIDADGTTTAFQNGRRRGRWQLEAEGRRLHIGSTVLDRSAALHRFEVDNDKRAVKIHLVFGPAGIARHEVLDGAYAVTVEALGAPASGTVWRGGMRRPRALRGWASLVRTRHGACERELVARRVDLHAARSGGTAAGAALLLVHQTAPDGTSRAWLGWRDAEGALHASREIRVEVEAVPSAGSAYALPASLTWSGGGADGRAVLKPPHLSIDPVDALPRLVRMLYSLGSRPRRVWSSARELQLEPSPGSADTRRGSPGPPWAPRGPGIASTTFLRPLDD